MNASTWLILNLVLLLGAAGSLATMRALARPELPPLTRNDSEGKGTRTTPPEPAAARPRTDLRSDELWEKSLFRPERSEAPDEGDAASANVPAEKSNFELTGLAWIGKVGEAKPVAVIRYNTAPAAAASRRRVPTQPRRPGAPPEPAEGEKPQKLVYAQGDTIGDTGYVLAEINTATNSVTLKRGNEHIDLSIEFGNSDSSQRKSEAVSAEQERRRQREQQAAAQIPPPASSPAQPAGTPATASPGQPAPATGPGQTAAASPATPPGSVPGSLPPPPPGTAETAAAPAAPSRFRTRPGSTTEATPGTVDRNQAQAIRERILQRQRPTNSSR